MIEEDFSRGRSSECETFVNEPLVPEGEFNIKNFEVIGVVYI
ncbi:MAG: TLD domain-containing protein [Candidatus Pacebacteria bacterium]|nr:TLD domain-containing protein [Candidatus Paceibacterota bacterium]